MNTWRRDWIGDRRQRWHLGLAVLLWGVVVALLLDIWRRIMAGE